MRITPLMPNLYINPPKAPTFQSIIRDVRDSNGNIKNSNSTCFYSKDIDWKNFSDYLFRKYQKNDKVNVFSFGCSDGSEPMSLAILLDTHNRYEARKFFPIIAKDNDEFILNRLRSSNVRAYFSDIDKIVEFSDNHLGRYFIIKPQLPENESMIIHPTYELNNRIRYINSDVRKSVNALPSKDTVLMIRNIVPYLGNEAKQEEFINTVTSKLKENCVVVIGDLEEDLGIGQKLEDAGFVPTEIDHVYETKSLSGQV